MVIYTPIDMTSRNDARNASGTIQSRFIGIGNYPRSAAGWWITGLRSVAYASLLEALSPIRPVNVGYRSLNTESAAFIIS